MPGNELGVEVVSIGESWEALEFSKCGRQSGEVVGVAGTTRANA